MILDIENMFDFDVPITETRNSTGVIDLPKPSPIGLGEPLFITVQVMQSFTAEGAATLQIALVTDDDPDLSAPTVLQDQVAVIPVADLVAGFKREFRIHPTLPGVMKKYLGLVYTVATGPMTAGKIRAGITHDIGETKAYPANVTTA